MRWAAGSLLRALSPLDAEKLREVLDYRIARLEPKRGKEILKRLTVRLSRSRGDHHRDLAPVVAAMADLWGRLKGTDAGARSALRRSLAAGLDARASALERMAGDLGTGADSRADSRAIEVG